MESNLSYVYRCKKCATVIRDRRDLQHHLHWHYISDTDLDAYFSQEAGTEPSGPATVSTQPPDAPPRRSKPSYGVLWGCLAILAALGVAYYVSN